MSRKSRMWIGVTFIAILALNYALIGIPLVGKTQTIEEKYRTILIKQVKSGEVLKNTGDEYLLGIFRKEKEDIDRKMLVLNAFTASLLIIAVSWIVFGMIIHKGK